MANSYGSNPIVLDTFTSAIDVGSTMFGDSDAKFKIEHIEWQTPTTVAHTALITNAASVPIFSETATVAKESILKQFNGVWITGIKIAALGVGSGKVVILLK